MTDIRVNSILPAARMDSSKNSSSSSDFLFSLQSVSAADIGIKASAPNTAAKRTDSPRQAAQVSANSSSSQVRNDSGANANITQRSGQTDSGKAQGTSPDTYADGINSQGVSAEELQGTAANGTAKTARTAEKAGAELSELRNQTVAAEGERSKETSPKQPMLDLNRILERLGSFVGEQDALSAEDTSEINVNTSEMTESEGNPAAAEKDVSFSVGENAPVIDLNRILEAIKADEGSEKAEEKTPESGEPIRSDFVRQTTQAALPQIDFEKIMESVKGVQEEGEVIPSADRINAAEAEKPVKRDRVSDSGQIAANIGLVWDTLTAVADAAAESPAEADSTGSETVNTDIDRVREKADPQESETKGAMLEPHLLSRYALAVRETVKPSTLEELKDKLEEAMQIAAVEMNDSANRAEKPKEKILESLLKVLKKSNGDDEENKDIALDSKKDGDLGILLQIIENMIDDARDGSQIADSKENVFETVPAAADESVGNGYGAYTYAYKPKDAESRADRTSENTIDYGKAGAAEGRYAPAADGNAGKTVTETQDVSTVKNLVSAIPAGQVNGYLSKTEENPDDLDAKAMKVLSKPNRDGKIRETELPDEFAELKKLIEDMKKTHEDDEEEKDEDDDEKEAGEGGKGVKGDSKSDIIRAVSIKASEPGEAAIAKSFSMERSGAKQILTQIATEVLNNLPKEKRTVALVMTLTPENLGKVTLKITEQAGKLNVTVTAHSKETAEILASRMDGLQDALKDSGTQLEKYQVVYGPEHEADARQQSYEGSSKNPYVRQDDEEGTDSESDFSELLKEAV